MRKIAKTSVYRFVFIAGCIATAVACSKKADKVKPTPDPDPDTIITVQTIDTLAPSVPLKQVGLQSEEDFTRIKAKIAANQEPWLSGWNKLIANSHAQATYTPGPVEILIRGTTSEGSENYSRAFNDAAAAYQLALRWKISGDIVYAQAGINILNAWARTCKRVAGDTNASLAYGLYGYQFAIAGIMLKGYTGWNATDFAAYQKWMMDVFYPGNLDFLTRHHGTCYTHYWANWDLANLTSVLAIGILNDNRHLYNYAVDYLQRGGGNGNWFKAINYVFDGDNAGLAQLQESGRDQGHATLVIGLLGHIAQLTWNQGDDFYGLDDNRFLKACEYTAKYNVANMDVPFHEYIRKWEHDCRSEVYTVVASGGRGTVRPIWAGPYNHYAKIKKLPATATKFTMLGANSVKPEGGGGDYGSNSGGFDQLGFGTLLYSLE